MELDFFIEFTKIVLPAGLVLLAMYLSVKSFMDREYQKNVMELKINNSKHVLPIRLQAYERITLFLERINPKSIIVRLNDSSLSAIEFQHTLISEIRNEYNHNISMQIYVSENAWDLIKNAMEETISLVNQSASGLTHEHRAIDLAKRIIENTVRVQEDPTQKALLFVKGEVSQFF